MNIVPRPNFSVTKIHTTGSRYTEDFDDYEKAKYYFESWRYSNLVRHIYLFNHHTMMVDLDSNSEKSDEH